MKKATKTEKKKDETKIVDASGRTLGRIASEAAVLLLGKDKATFERNVYSGSPVRVINALKLRVTGKKLEDIEHKRYSGIPGGLRVTKGVETIEKKGMKELIRLAIYQMLPGNKLRRDMMKHLTIED